MKQIKKIFFFLIPLLLTSCTTSKKNLPIIKDLNPVTVALSSSYFQKDKFTISPKFPIGIQIDVSFSTPYPLSSYEIYAFLSDSNDKIHTYHETQKINLEPNSSIYYSLTEKVLVFPDLKEEDFTYEIRGTTTLSDKTKIDKERQRFAPPPSTILFASPFTVGDEKSLPLVPQIVGEPIKKPKKDPIRPFKTFLGYSFYEVGPVIELSNLAYKETLQNYLYPQYELDSELLTNFMNNTTINSNFKIINELSNNAFETATAGGSGVIFGQLQNRYLLLTNNHVVALDPEYKRQEITVYDSFGQGYSGNIERRDPKYDLAVISFESLETYPLIPFSFQNPDLNSEVVSMSNPNLQTNLMSFGKVLEYDQIKIDAPTWSTDIDFAVIHSSTPIKSGSSGGSLLNTDLELVGILYASVKDEIVYLDGNTYVIPILMVNSYLLLPYID